MRHLPSRPGSGHHGCRSAQQHAGLGTADSACEIHRVLLRPVPPGALTGTPQLNLGRNLLSRYGCVHCHTVKRPDGTKMKATDDPPSLAHIADKTTREWIYAWLKDPQAYATTATMPNFKLSDDDARDISAFLMGSSTPRRGR